MNTLKSGLVILLCILSIPITTCLLLWAAGWACAEEITKWIQRGQSKV